MYEKTDLIRMINDVTRMILMGILSFIILLLLCIILLCIMGDEDERSKRSISIIAATSPGGKGQNDPYPS